MSNYGDEYSGSASLATATTHSDNSVYSQLGTSLSGGIGSIADTAPEDGYPDQPRHHDGRDVFRQRQSFRALQPGAHPGWAREWRHPIEMAHAYETLAHDGQLVSGTMADSPGEPDRDPASRRLATTTRSRPTRAIPARTGLRPSRSSPPRRRHGAHHAPQRGHGGNRYQMRTTVTRTSGARPARRRTTATPGSSAPIAT